VEADGREKVAGVCFVVFLVLLTAITAGRVGPLSWVQWGGKERVPLPTFQTPPARWTHQSGKKVVG